MLWVVANAISSTHKELMTDLAFHWPIINVIHTLLHSNVKIKMLETAGLILVSIVLCLPYAQ